MSKRCFIYDDENMSIDDYGILKEQLGIDTPILCATSITDTYGQTYIDGLPEYKITAYLDTYSHKVELDPTTMLKIAKYNKSIELKELNDDIKDSKDELKELKKKIKKYENMISEIKDMISDYVKSDYTDFEEFLSRKYEHNEDYYDDY